MKRAIPILLLIILTIYFSCFVSAEPPSFNNHQFYGEVSWNKTQVDPKTVVAESSLGNFTSVIEILPCLDTICAGKYGYNADNILRVKGKEGETIIFYLNKKAVNSYTYQNSESTKLDLSLASPAMLKTEEVKIDGSQAGTGPSSDGKKTSDSGAAPVTATCTQNWECGSWSLCIGDSQQRKCYRVDTCDKLFAEKKVSAVLSSPKPKESQSCTSETPAKTEEKPAPVKKPASCTDGIKNQNELGVDCGGVCKACPPAKKETDWTLYLLIAGIVLVLGAIGGLLYFFVFKPKSSVLDESTMTELEDVYSTQESRGMATEEITRRLVERGWDEKVLKKFLKKR